MQKKIAETKPTDAAVRVSASCSVIETPNVRHNRRVKAERSGALHVRVDGVVSVHLVLTTSAIQRTISSRDAVGAPR